MFTKPNPPLTISPEPPTDPALIELAGTVHTLASALADPDPAQTWFWIATALLAVATPAAVYLATTDSALAAHLPAALAANQLSPTTLVTQPAPAARFAKAYQRLTRRALPVPTALTTYRASAELTTPTAPGYLRYAVPRDHKLLATWTTDPDFPLDTTLLTAALTARRVVLWDAQHNPVALAVYTPPAAGSAALSALYTPPLQRHLNYAAALLTALATKLAPTTLVATLPDSPTVTLLTRLGYTNGPPLLRYELGA